MIVINDKSFLENFLFAGFQSTAFKYILSGRKTVLLKSTRMHVKAGKDLWSLFGTDEEMAQKWYFWQVQLKSAVTIWKPS